MDHTSPIFDKWYLYGCYVPYGATVSEQEMSEFGLRATGVEELDERLADMPVKVYITINDMVELYKAYYPITVASVAEAKMVYESITNYTAKWKAYLSTYSLNRSKLPVDDLILLEEFAYYLRGHAVVDQTNVKIHRGLTSVLGGILPSAALELCSDHDTQLLDLFKDYKSRGGLA